MAEEEQNPGEVVVRVYEQKKRTAPIWQHFEKVFTSHNRDRIRCKRCQNLYSGTTSNSTLTRHFEKSCSYLRHEAARQPTIDNQGNPWYYNEDICRQLTTKCVIQAALPFGFFAHPYLVQTIQQAMQPRYIAVSRQTLKRDALDMWDIAKNEMKTFFQQFDAKISLTSDMWSAPHGSQWQYICITAHWIETGTWQLMKRVIAFEQFDSPHKSERMFRIIRRACERFHIVDKVLSIAFDNASNNTAAINLLEVSFQPMCGGVFFHQRCNAHIINLVVRDGLHMIQHHIYELRLLLKRIFGKPSIQQKFYEHCHAMGRQHVYRPIHDNVTRWNSTYYMFQNALLQEDMYKTFYPSRWPRNNFTEESWSAIKVFTDLLGTFKDASVILSGVYYATSPLVLMHITNMAGKLKEYENDPVTCDAVIYMKAKFLKYYQHLSAAIMVASVFHPYLNMHGTQSLIRTLGEYLGLEVDDINYNMGVLDGSLNSVFTHYKQASTGGSTTQNASTSRGGAGPSSNPQPNARSFHALSNVFSNIQTQRNRLGRTDTDLSELRMYMNGDFLVGEATLEAMNDLDLMTWWKDHAIQFPVMATVARDILTIQASTVASEAAFSLSGRILSERRNRMMPPTVEMCVCLKDYLDSVQRRQHFFSLEVENEAFEAELDDIDQIELQLLGAETRSNSTTNDDDEYEESIPAPTPGEVPSEPRDPFAFYDEPVFRKRTSTNPGSSSGGGGSRRPRSQATQVSGSETQSPSGNLNLSSPYLHDLDETED